MAPVARVLAALGLAATSQAMQSSRAYAGLSRELGARAAQATAETSGSESETKSEIKSQAKSTLEIHQAASEKAESKSETKSEAKSETKSQVKSVLEIHQTHESYEHSEGQAAAALFAHAYNFVAGATAVESQADSAAKVQTKSVLEIHQAHESFEHSEGQAAVELLGHAYARLEGAVARKRGEPDYLIKPARDASPSDYLTQDARNSVNTYINTHKPPNVPVASTDNTLPKPPDANGHPYDEPTWAENAAAADAPVVLVSQPGEAKTAPVRPLPTLSEIRAEIEG